MKTLLRKLLILMLIVTWAFPAWSQINTTAGSVTSCPGEIQVPINVTNCNGIGAISLVLNFDNTKLAYLGYTELNAALTTGLLIINSTGTRIVISWANTTAANLGTSTMVKFRFTAIPGTSTLAWDTQTPGNCEYSDILGNVLSATFTNGTATINQPPLINVQPVNTTVLVGFNTSLSVSATGTGLTYIWQISTNSGGSWADLINNTTYSGVTGPTLYITNALLSYNGYQYRCKLTGTCTPVTYTFAATLTVVYPITTTLPTASSCPGNLVAPVTVNNFTGVAAFSLTFAYNTSCLTYSGYQSVNAALSGGLLSVNASGGKVYITWSNTVAASITTGPLIELLFTSVTGTSPLTWDVANEGACEYTALSGTLYTGVFVNGNETIYGIPTVTSHPIDRIIAKTQSTSFSITATGSGLSYIWQLSTDGGLGFTDLTNNATYSNVTTPTMSVTNAQLTMSGYYYRCKVSGTCTPLVYSNAAKLTVLPNIFTTCQSATVCPGQLIIPVNVTDFIGVASFSMTLIYNPAILTFTGVQNLNTALSTGSFVNNASGGKVYLTWSNTTAATIASGGTLLELMFNGVPGSSSLNWDTQTLGNCEYSDITGLVIFSTWTNGSATVNAPPTITSEPVNASIYAGGSKAFGLTATGTGLSYTWQLSTNGGISWANVPNATPYAGIASPTLTINPAATGLNGYEYRCIVNGTCTPKDTSNAALLTVTQAAITTTPGSVTSSCTGNVSVPVNVVNCNNVGSFSLTMNFDTSKMSFDGYHSANASLSGGLLAVNSSGTKVFISWAATAAINIGTATLLQLRFKADPAISTTLTWDTQTTGACEYADPNGTVITSFYNTATVSTIVNALIVNAGPDKFKSGASVQLDGSATGGVTPYTYSWTPTASLNNPAIASPLASPTVTTTYTLVVTGNNGCAGTDVMVVSVNAIPNDLTLQNITLQSGATECYNAYQTIIVAGSGTNFLVQNGASATLIAGLKINFLPGTTVQSGGYLHGYISTNGQYCNGQTAPLVATTTEEFPDIRQNSDLFSVYPNPTTGHVNIRLNDLKQPATVTIYGSRGEILNNQSGNIFGSREFSLDNLPSGIYFIRVNVGNQPAD